MNQPSSGVNQSPDQGSDEEWYQPEQSTSQYSGYAFDDNLENTDQPQTNQQIAWTASEYVHHSKGALWLVGFIAIVALLLALAIWSQAWTFAVLIVVMGVAMGIIAFRKPHELHYTLSDDGLTIDDKAYAFSDFRAFGVVDDGALYSIMLIPIKRLAPTVAVYFEEQDGEQIVDILGTYLPMEEFHQDLFDRLMHRLRF
jgi:hypothetical protein